MKEQCRSWIEFAMEAPGFLIAFQCDKNNGHHDDHIHEGNQRQRKNARQQFYTLTWVHGKKPKGDISMKGRK